MVCFSFLEPAAREKIIPKAIDKNVGVIAMKSFSGGVLDNPKLALKYVLSQPGIMIIPGVEHKALFDHNLAVFKGSYHLDDQEKQEIEKIRQRYDKKFCRRCDYCLPCEEEIPIQFVMGLRSMVRRMGTGILETPMFKNMLDRSANCSECGDCMERCPYDLPIPDMIKSNLDWVKAL